MATTWITWRETEENRWITNNYRWRVQRILYDGVWQWSLTRVFWHPKYPDKMTGETMLASASARDKTGRDALMDLVDEIDPRRTR